VDELPVPKIYLIIAIFRYLVKDEWLDTTGVAVSLCRSDVTGVLLDIFQSSFSLHGLRN
jgi:hypothetical protein